MMLALVLLSSLVASPQPLDLKAADGNMVKGFLYPADNAAEADVNKPLVFLFHQAGSSAGEYVGIGERLQKMGLNALAIDQRSGGKLYGANATAARYKSKQSYLQARPDLEGALAWASERGFKGPQVVWGSSYSAALVFLVAADHPEVTALLAFSPGEYLKPKKGAVTAAARKLTIPVLVLTPPKEDKRARPIAQAVPNQALVSYATPKGSVHGSSMLKKGKAKKEAWLLVEGFLSAHVLKPAMPQTEKAAD